MILGRPLTPDETAISRLNYERYNLLNGASYMCLGEFVLTLYATQVHCPNWIIALLGSMVFLGYLLLPFGIKLTAKRGAAICQADFWVRRNLAALLTASSVLLADVYPIATWGIVLIGAFLFYGYRAAGCVLSTPLVGDFSPPEEVPITIGRATERFYISAFITIITISLLTHYFPGRSTLVGIILFGSFLGITASTFLRNVHETGALKEAAKQPLLPSLRAAIHNRDLRRLALGWFGLNFAKICLLSISTVAVKRGCGFSDAAACVCAIAMYLGSTLVSRFAGRACRNFGPRLILLLAFSCNALVVLFWLLMPFSDSTSKLTLWLFVLPIFGLLGALNATGETSAHSYFLMICPDKEDQVSGAVSLNLITGVAAGVTGSVLSPLFIHYAEAFAPYLGSYFGNSIGYFRLYFVALFPILVACFFAILRMRTVIYHFRETHGENAVHQAVAVSSHHKH